MHNLRDLITGVKCGRKKKNQTDCNRTLGIKNF